MSETLSQVARIPITLTSELSDKELVRRTLAGEPDAFDILIERHTHRLYRVIYRMSSDRAEAEAVVQEAFLRAWENLRRWKPDQPFWPWLAQIAINAARDALKKSRPLDFADVSDEPVEAIAVGDLGPEETVVREEDLARLAAAVQRLPTSFQLIISLRYHGEMSYEEIATALSLPLNTVRTHLRRAKQQLRELLEADDG